MERDWPGVFVSSTCLDLIDLRAELEVHLKDLGFLPVTSDGSLSDFVVAGDQDAVETCLVNVRNASTFVCVLSQRYGGRWPGRGNLSTTHLEYKAACETGMPVLVYARDRLLAEYELWKKNRAATFSWVDESQRGVFELMAEHDERVKQGKSNWLGPFRNSTELKVMLARDLGARARRYRLRRLLDEDRAPIVVPRFGGMSGNELSAECENVGPVAASNAVAYQPTPNGRAGESWLGQIGPGGKVHAKVRYVGGLGGGAILVVRYSTSSGDTIEDEHRLEARPGVAAHLELVRRRLVDAESFAIGEPDAAEGSSK
ncbi:MAG: DUF4062 domain-containing protein [Polyangiaceae bacterium]